MGYKDLLVVVDAKPHARERVLLAVRLAERFDAHLVGLHVTMVSDVGFWNRNSSKDDAERSRLLFDDAVAGRSISAEWRVARGSPSLVAAMHGRYADLAILGQLDPDESGAGEMRPRPEEVALLTGRPILVVPYAGAFADTGQRVVVGWDASREATRAVNDAMPLLATASAVTVLSIDPEERIDRHGDIPGADIARHLARHGVKAAVQSTISAGIGIGNTLLSRASDLAADLLVMGAYGHSRVREQLLGGATRTVLASMTLPVLMAH
jgi:nucleotide-binding universal stress UspA family protein